MRKPVKRSDTCVVKSPSAVILYISTHGKPHVQSNYLVGTNCCMMSTQIGSVNTHSTSSHACSMWMIKP